MKKIIITVSMLYSGFAQATGTDISGGGTSIEIDGVLVPVDLIATGRAKFRLPAPSPKDCQSVYRYDWDAAQENYADRHYGKWDAVHEIIVDRDSGKPTAQIRDPNAHCLGLVAGTQAVASAMPQSKFLKAAGFDWLPVRRLPSFSRALTLVSRPAKIGESPAEAKLRRIGRLFKVVLNTHSFKYTERDLHPTTKYYLPPKLANTLEKPTTDIRFDATLGAVIKRDRFLAGTFTLRTSHFIHEAGRYLQENAGFLAGDKQLQETVAAFLTGDASLLPTLAPWQESALEAIAGQKDAAVLETAIQAGFANAAARFSRAWDLKRPQFLKEKLALDVIGDVDRALTRYKVVGKLTIPTMRFFYQLNLAGEQLRRVLPQAAADLTMLTQQLAVLSSSFHSVTSFGKAKAGNLEEQMRYALGLGVGWISGKYKDGLTKIRDRLAADYDDSFNPENLEVASNYVEHFVSRTVVHVQPKQGASGAVTRGPFKNRTGLFRLNCIRRSIMSSVSFTGEVKLADGAHGSLSGQYASGGYLASVKSNLGTRPFKIKAGGNYPSTVITLVGQDWHIDFDISRTINPRAERSESAPKAYITGNWDLSYSQSDEDITKFGFVEDSIDCSFTEL